MYLKNPLVALNSISFESLYYAESGYGLVFAESYLVFENFAIMFDMVQTYLRGNGLKLESGHVPLARADLWARNI